MTTEGGNFGLTVVIDREKVGLNLAAVAEVDLDRHHESTVGDFEQAIEASPEIVRCVSATGPVEFGLAHHTRART